MNVTSKPLGGNIRQFAAPILGTNFIVLLHGPQSGGAMQQAVEAGLAFAREIEQLTDRRNPNSAIAHLSKQVVGEYAVDGRLWQMLYLARQLAERSGGYFDPTLRPHDGARGRARAWASYECLPGPTVRMHQPVRLSLGGLAQGYALDLLAGELRRRGFSSFCANAGGAIIAVGTPPGEAGWPISVATPDSAPALMLDLRDEAMATAGGRGQRLLLSDLPANPTCLGDEPAKPRPTFSGISVLAPTASEADALVKAAYYAWPRTLPKQNPRCLAIAVRNDGRLERHPLG